MTQSNPEFSPVQPSCYGMAAFLLGLMSLAALVAGLWLNAQGADWKSWSIRLLFLNATFSPPAMVIAIRSLLEPTLERRFAVASLLLNCPIFMLLATRLA